MILQDLRLPELENCEKLESGLDSLELCSDKDAFLTYPYKFTYKYNSRGFRDYDWPTESLEDVIWCIGDSFTQGLGCPLEHTWPKLLEKETGKKTIIVAMDGASNDWICRRALKIINEIHPKNMVVMWSFFNRRESTNKGLSDLERRIWVSPNTTDTDDFICSLLLFQSLQKKKKDTNLIHFTIPNAYSRQHKMPLIQNITNYVGEVVVLDRARDNFHFDILTSQQVVKQIIPLLTT